MDIITGKTGKPHVTSQQDREINMSMFGKGNVVLPIGQQLRAELTSSNNIRIYDGMLSMQGCVASIRADGYQDLTLESLTTGSERIDYVCAKYVKENSTGYESISLVVVSGTDGNPPTIAENEIRNGATEAYFPLYSIKIKSATELTLTPLFENVTPILPQLNDIAKTNRLLYQGEGLFMTENQSITLSEKISQQPTGIVIIWSAYRDGQSQNFHWYFQFVPKFILSLPTTTKRFDTDIFLCAGGQSQYAAMKELTITDDVIYGRVGNSSNKLIVNGITCVNNEWVLRAVIGV
nr:MAG TPA: hypothetical protein [Caudoviricetes sp.]